jgi:group I intron endonuclease
MKTMGIYKIFNKVNNKYYIGSSNNIKRRWRDHKKMLRGNRHDNIYLQNSWNKYGENNFDFIVIDNIKKSWILRKLKNI